MVAVTGGSMDISSTPAGKQGFFWDIFDPTKEMGYTKFYISGEDCPRYTKEFLESEKKRMSKLEYAQEYLAVFLDELQRVFSDELLNKVCLINKSEIGIDWERRHYLGCDVAGLGRDETAFSVLEKKSDTEIKQVENITLKKTYTTDVSDKIIELEHTFDFRLIGVDDGGAGFGVFSELLRNDKTKRKVRALNNSSRPLDKDGKRKTKLLKEEMYLNILSLMEHGQIKLFNDNEVISSLKSVQFEHHITEGRKTELRIFGNNTHIAEALIRAAWLLVQDKSLNIWCSYN
jgi:hypothetical protein